jgi:hypothetical protein
MRPIKTLFLILTLCGFFIFTDCEKIGTFSFDGFYEGYFSYRGQVQYDALIINANAFKEVPSGGAMNQKFPCLTKGTYRIKQRSIKFVPDTVLLCTCSACTLTGEYALIQSGEKIIFQKGSGDDLQTYNLTFVKFSPH